MSFNETLLLELLSVNETHLLEFLSVNEALLLKLFLSVVKVLIFD